MTNKIRTLPAKIICFILCIIAIAVAVACVLGAVFLAYEDFYIYSEGYLFETSAYNELNGDGYQITWRTLQSESLNKYTEDNSNIRYCLFAPDGKAVGSNISGITDMDINLWQYEFSYYVTQDESGYFVSRYDVIDSDIYKLCVYLESGLPVADEYALMYDVIHIAHSLRYALFPIGGVSLLVSLVLFVTLMCVSGRRPNSDEIHEGVFCRVPFDILLAISGIFALLMILIIGNANWTDEFLLALFIAAAFLAGTVMLGLCMSAAARIKAHTFLKNTVIYMVLRLCLRIFKWLWRKFKALIKGICELISVLPMIWRTVIIVAILIFTDFFILIQYRYDGSGVTAFMWIVKNGILAIFAIYMAIFMRKLQKGGEALAKGDLNYKTNTDMMFWDFKRHGENLNQISEGMTKAVAESLQSERMKAELITNVSHDIKTPLTSIINYAGLIANDECENEKRKEYAEVLVRKSEHLKRLLDDIVEISKATTGNLEVDISPCEAAVLLSQTAGEFQQRCEDAGLELITKRPDENIFIMADSRRIWRIFENLMNNICKYSLPNSRVYLTLEQDGDDALFIFRNTSKNTLNITPQELMERFVRGDASRSTDGNGLGLSIAKSLTELQNGKMDIYIDGDLFKVILRFPIV